MMKVVSLLLLLSCFSAFSSQEIICIGDRVGVEHNCSLFASNLSSALRDNQVRDGSKLLFLNQYETIESLIEFVNLSHLTLFGFYNTNIVCNQEAVQYGLKFVNVTDIEVVGLTFFNCGALYHHESTDDQGIDNYNFSSAVYFENCTNVNISDIAIHNSHGVGLTLYDCNENVHITHSTFNNNTVSEVDQELSTGQLLGGGGIYYELTACSPLQPTCDPSTNTYNRHSSFYLYNCTFSYNSVISQSNDSDYSKYICGGLMIWLSGLAYNNTISIDNSYFDGNVGLYGGGLFVMCRENCSNNSVIISNSTIVHNKASLGGGGMDLGFYFTTTRNRFNSIVVRSCTIMDNKAYFGGGTVFFVTSASQVDPSNCIEFHDTIWKHNMATYGSAIYLEPIFNNVPANIIFPVPHFVNCEFSNNYITFDTTGNLSSGIGISASGAGAMNSKSISFTLSGLITFDGNNGTALYIVDSNAIFTEETSVIFSNNTGIYGGAVSINAFASMYTSRNTSFMFLDNVASVKGGAIFSHSIDIQTSVLTAASCFVERIRTTETFEMLFYFKNNSDSFGKSIYVSSLLPCNKLCQGTHVHLNYIPPDILLSDCVGNFTFTDYNGTVEGNVATETSEFDHFEADDTEKWIIPGKDFLIPFVTRDELGHESMEPLFGILTANNESLRLNHIYTANNMFQIRGQPNDTGHLEIGTLHYRNLTAGISIMISSCPPGFINKNNTCVCSADYDNNHYNGIVRCDNKEFVASLTSGFWVGYVGSESENTLFSGLCPQGYCNDNQTFRILPSVPSFTQLDSMICGGNNRTGVLCGDCIENNSVYYNSPGYKCGNNELCSYGPLFYLLSSIIPLTLMFTIIIMLGVNFSSGTWNGFVFFAQIVGYFTATTNGVAFVSFPERIFHIISVLIYGPFSLKFFNDDSLSYCLFKDATFFTVMGVEILSLLFAFVLVVVLVFVMKSNYFYRIQTVCCKRPFFKTTTLTKALTTFLILCYSQTTQLCFKILEIGFLTNKGNSVVYPLRVQQMGSQEYFTGFHIPLFIVAIIGILTVVTVTPLFLIAYPVFYKILPQKLQEKKLIAFLLTKLEKLKPIFDAFQGCFEDKYRFFAGLYFLYRVILVSVFSLINVPLASLSVAQIIVMIILAIHLKFQPYKKKVRNNIDGCLFLLLGIINTLTLTRFFESLSQTQRGVKILTGLIQLLLVYIPMLVLLFGFVITKCRRSNKKKHNISIRKKSFVLSTKSESPTSDLETPHSQFEVSISYIDRDSVKVSEVRLDDGDKLREELQVLDF